MPAYMQRTSQFGVWITEAILYFRQPIQWQVESVQVILSKKEIKDHVENLCFKAQPINPSVHNQKRLPNTMILTPYKVQLVCVGAKAMV